MAETKASTIYIPLPTQNISFLSPREKRLTGYVSSVCGPLDKLLTPIRYVAVSESILYDKPGTGSAIEFMNSGSVISWILKGLTLGIAGIIVAFNLYFEYREQKKEKEKTEKELQNFRASLVRNGLNLEEEKKYNFVEEKRKYLAKLQLFNSFLKEALKENKDLQEKYESLELNYSTTDLRIEDIEKNLKLKVVGKKPENKASLKGTFEKFEDKVNRNVKPFYDIGNLVSFIYWALWITVGVITGVHSPFGIFGLPAWLTFLGPLAVVALPFMGIRIWNYIKHRRSGDGKTWAERNNDAKLKHQAEEDFDQIMNEANKKAELAYWKQQNQSLASELGVLNYEEKKSQRLAVESFDENSVFNAAAFNATVSGVIAGLASQVNFQYIAWFAVDALIAGVGITIGFATLMTPLGLGLLGLSVLFGVVAAGHRYLESQKSKNIARDDRDTCGLKNTLDLPNFEKMVEDKQNKLLGLKKELYAYKMKGFSVPDSLEISPELFKPEEVNLEGQSFSEKLKSFGSAIRKSPWIEALDWEMGSIFVTRMAVPAVSVAIFWGCASIAVVAALSNPIALALVFGVGTVLTVAKWYEKKQKKIEDHLVNLPKENANLDKDITLSELALDTVKKLAVKQGKEEVIQEISESAPTFTPARKVNYNPSNKKSSWWNFFKSDKPSLTVNGPTPRIVV